jgi:hypothetical protein
MLKKVKHIIFLCLFLFGLQCVANDKKDVSFSNFEIKSYSLKRNSKSITKPEKERATFSSLDKLHKKKRFSRTHYNTIAGLSKCNGLNLILGVFSCSKFSLFDSSKFHKNFSNYTFNNSFCHRKLLSIFYSFQAFW